MKVLPDSLEISLPYPLARLVEAFCVGFMLIALMALFVGSLGAVICGFHDFPLGSWQQILLVAGGTVTFCTLLGKALLA